MADNNANTPRAIAGFIDRDGVKHSVAGSGGGGDYSELIEMINGKISKPSSAAEGRIAVFGPDKTLVQGTWTMSGVDNAIKKLVRYGVMYSPTGSYESIPYITVVNSNNEYVIDLSASGEMLSYLADVQAGIFIPIKVKVGSDYHIGYYWTDGTNRTIHLEGLVFEYDTTNHTWLPAHACIISNQVPHWEKIGETSGFYDMATSTLYTSSEVTAKLYIGMPIRLYGKGSNLNKNYRSRVAGIMSGPTRVKISASMEDASSEGKFEIYVLSNLDSFFDFDSIPTQYSNKLMTSGGIYAALHALETRIATLEAFHAEPES